MRSFGNLNGSGWDYYTVYLNQSLMSRNGSGEAAFINSNKWAITAYQYNSSDPSKPIQVTAASPVPGPLPILGVGAAFGWSRKIRRRIKASAAAAPKSTN